MKIYRVRKPLQDNTSLDNIEIFDGETHTWCVKTYQYLGSTGGIRGWFDEIKKVKPDIIFFFSIKTEPITLPDGKRDKVTYIRSEFFKK